MPEYLKLHIDLSRLDENELQVAKQIAVKMQAYDVGMAIVGYQKHCREVDKTICKKESDGPETGFTA